ncbi:CBS domain-containing protein [Actinokineospora enzanensis]|uniref:CBS domain-containing protein n=1 Tax=Actinokineospora enzanensis TaxID=155975 RepID=UPI00037297DF|nr:CBS domain-containing protein [Actinokineospora enzanensis]
MRISDVLRAKGAEVATVAPGASVVDLVAALVRHNVGALVVTTGGGAADPVMGIVSERDVVHALGELGAAALEWTVEQLMSRQVLTCRPEDNVDGLASTMTEQRIRHVPVLDDGALVGIVSIGDVVKSHISQLEADRDQLHSYIAQG